MLSSYHQKYQERSEIDMQQRIRAKEYELEQIFARIDYKASHEPIKIAVLGCGSKRFVQAHRDIFGKILNTSVVVMTFDITTQHLIGESNIVEHDCTLPLPGAPYDITYASVLLKFIETEKQWDVIRNSYDALAAGGVSIHLFDTDDVAGDNSLLSDGYNPVPLDRWKKQLDEAQIRYSELTIKTGPNLESDSIAIILFRD